MRPAVQGWRDVTDAERTTHADRQVTAPATTNTSVTDSRDGNYTSNEPDPRVLDLYKLAVEMADRISSRRATANAFFITVETALVSVIGIATPTLHNLPWWVALAVAVAGLAVSGSWWLQLLSYRDLNRAKFIVINAMEADFPRQIYSDEWRILKSQSRRHSTSDTKVERPNGDETNGDSRWRALELGATERIIPVIFGALYILLFLGRVSRFM